MPRIPTQAARYQTLKDAFHHVQTLRAGPMTGANMGPAYRAGAIEMADAVLAYLMAEVTKALRG